MNTETSPPISAGLEWAHPLVRDWFVSRFGTPTEPQQEGWPHILVRKTTLISAPTGSGKTLAAFLICIDRLVRKALSGELTNRTEVLYVSPLKALARYSGRPPWRATSRLTVDAALQSFGYITKRRTGSEHSGNVLSLSRSED